jgi:hypothetical protein
MARPVAQQVSQLVHVPMLTVQFHHQAMRMNPAQLHLQQ